ncbi:Crp/Fnr family transcriptional regulator [Paraflavitalea speifideaquila]|uniref:Crp/Fnr family transcriptional regulator n=1 Tax=Paraflavitalea speifideaquila TaxID=3076558 RepID=UPI0028EB4966|nr:Crp/Fnr family transcriptional regulator [Paraflavitalea speifideiaquila]
MEFITRLQYKNHPVAANVDPLLEVLDSIKPLSKRLRKYIAQQMLPCSIQKGKLLLRPGEICSHIFFVRSGVLRGFVKNGATDSTTWITMENQFVAAISSFVFQAKTIEYVQAIEDCELLALSHADLEYIYEKFPSFNEVARKIYEQYYADAENRALLTRLKNAALKYNHFLHTHANLSNRIPQKYIASYLGIASETLSRLRSKNAAASRTKRKKTPTS